MKVKRVAFASLYEEWEYWNPYYEVGPETHVGRTLSHQYVLARDTHSCGHLAKHAKKPRSIDVGAFPITRASIYRPWLQCVCQLAARVDGACENVLVWECESHPS